MYIANAAGGYTRDGQQWARGRFLLLFDDDTRRIPLDDNGRTGPGLLACIRSVSLRQLGHFMMGRARVGKHVLTVSGQYGGDGLPAHWPGWPLAPIPEDLRTYLVPVPDVLARQYWVGTRDAAAAAALREWARTLDPAQAHQRRARAV